jgi:excisionase family DNA binding protein
MNARELSTNGLMTIPETQSHLRLGLTSVYRLINDGRLEKVKIGAATRITRLSVDRLIAQSSTNGGC